MTQKQVLMAGDQSQRFLPLPWAACGRQEQPHVGCQSRSRGGTGAWRGLRGWTSDPRTLASPFGCHSQRTSGRPNMKNLKEIINASRGDFIPSDDVAPAGV